MAVFPAAPYTVIVVITCGRTPPPPLIHPSHSGIYMDLRGETRKMHLDPRGRGPIRRQNSAISWLCLCPSADDQLAAKPKAVTGYFTGVQIPLFGFAGHDCCVMQIACPLTVYPRMRGSPPRYQRVVSAALQSGRYHPLIPRGLRFTHSIVCFENTIPR